MSKASGVNLLSSAYMSDLPISQVAPYHLRVARHDLNGRSVLDELTSATTEDPENSET